MTYIFLNGDFKTFVQIWRLLSVTVVSWWVSWSLNCVFLYDSLSFLSMCSGLNSAFSRQCRLLLTSAICMLGSFRRFCHDVKFGKVRCCLYWKTCLKFWDRFTFFPLILLHFRRYLGLIFYWEIGGGYFFFACMVL